MSKEQGIRIVDASDKTDRRLYRGMQVLEGMSMMGVLGGAVATTIYAVKENDANAFSCAVATAALAVSTASFEVNKRILSVLNPRATRRARQ